MAQMCLLVVLDASYTKVEKKECFRSKYGSYGTLDEAKHACDYDERCFAVYDYQCNNEGRFSLCRKGYPVKYDYWSCIYRKSSLRSGKHCAIATVS